MADETPETEETPEPVAEETPAEETPVAEEPAAEAPAEEAPAEEPVAEAPAAPPAEPVALPTPKERKAVSRARRGLRRGATPEERAEARAKKAVARRRRRQQEREKANAARTEVGPKHTAKSTEHGPGRPKTRQGIVVSDKADKTITVRVDDARRHRKYEKIVRSSQTLHAHDETNNANAGDLVQVIECRPLSATKRWRLVDVLERAK
jgi:small subunit ribosomal protein S17